MTIQQLKARLDKLEARHAQRKVAARDAEVVRKDCERFRELMSKDWRKLTPAELQERNELGFRYTPRHNIMMAYERALDEGRAECKSAAEVEAYDRKLEAVRLTKRQYIERAKATAAHEEELGK
jgi:hypothetical protein